jgi:hypothetical protein
VSRRHWEAWAREAAADEELTPVQAHLLIALASYADADGECFPGLATLAARLRRGERETSRALTDLQRLGLISRRGRGPGRTRLTRLLADSRPAATHDQASDSRPVSSQEDSRPAATQQDSRPTATKTRGEPLPRLAAHRAQNPQKEPPAEPPEETPFPSIDGSPYRDAPHARAHAREASDDEPYEPDLPEEWAMIP